MTPEHINPLHWHQAMGYARQACARVFRDGGAPVDALKAFGLASAGGKQSWDKTVERIAMALCDQPHRRAA
ncbi:MAG: hypothetical protein JNM89_14915 [Hyphomicrobiaceae bacterium]|nr:hypothetical protein [Hyphomicrobiaceae bacterium]